MHMDEKVYMSNNADRKLLLCFISRKKITVSTLILSSILLKKYNTRPFFFYINRLHNTKGYKVHLLLILSDIIM